MKKWSDSVCSLKCNRLDLKYEKKSQEWLLSFWTSKVKDGAPRCDYFWEKPREEHCWLFWIFSYWDSCNIFKWRNWVDGWTCKSRIQERSQSYIWRSHQMDDKPSGKTKGWIEVEKRKGSKTTFGFSSFEFFIGNTGDKEIHHMAQWRERFRM